MAKSKKNPNSDKMSAIDVIGKEGFYKQVHYHYKVLGTIWRILLKNFIQVVCVCGCLTLLN